MQLKKKQALSKIVTDTTYTGRVDVAGSGTIEVNCGKTFLFITSAKHEPNNFLPSLPIDEPNCIYATSGFGIYYPGLPSIMEQIIWYREKWKWKFDFAR